VGRALGVIARKAGDRALACDSWRAAAAAWDDSARQSELPGYHANMLQGIRQNLALCDSGAPVSAFRALTDHPS